MLLKTNQPTDLDLKQSEKDALDSRESRRKTTGENAKAELPWQQRGGLDGGSCVPHEPLHPGGRLDKWCQPFRASVSPSAKGWWCLVSAVLRSKRYTAGKAWGRVWGAESGPWALIETLRVRWEVRVKERLGRDGESDGVSARGVGIFLHGYRLLQR